MRAESFAVQRERRVVSPHRPRPVAALPAAIAALLGIAPAFALATNRLVTSCLDDNTPGTLRAVIAAPTTVSGDTVDLSALSCPASTITLANGGDHIAIPQASLTLKGPTDSTLTIDGTPLNDAPYNYSNVLYHTGAGTLTVSHLSITGGHQKHQKIDALGGCIYSKANVSLAFATLTSCTSYSAYVAARGGGVYAKGNVTLDHVIIGASSATGATASGGGVHAKGLLTMTRSTIAGNAAVSGGTAFGGGVYAFGNVVAQYSQISGNSASSQTGSVYGGGVLANANFTLQSSTLSGNSASVAGNTATLGGGAKVGGNALVTYSTVSDNAAYGPGFGGGLNLGGAVNTIVSSTISGNLSQGGFAGIDAFSGGAAGSSFQMRNSTVSGNHAFGYSGGVYVDSRTAKFYNSTIAFNEAGAAPGLELAANNAAIAVTLQSNLLSNNAISQSADSDLTTIANGFAITFNGGNLAAPANNLVRVTATNNLPTDTIGGACPRLGPLRDNGGLTKTHALLSGSPAVDAGNNLFLLFFDQRGSSLTNGTQDYPRVSGDSNKPDIGAYEVQQADIVFGTSFEACAPLPF